ncbi:N5,N10-methylene tetrahydromethanopterin reductase [Salinibacterium sp. G-O1]|uniref:N5,N10-methylene tetrahydromethanopterin reductase n=1 Tax=Salinibacterium sp. G-O1 TaxID=3046208 RepID=UPI0024B89BC5|nr:N5,N10-methylene tetrahydromethanopterin reductase [Salinibacterium sp. G-O1]MDJ0333917.1 N5,N10-methylene tetrahydromethanopterin reductase [Salinibacterium sp. G-O1]
MDLSRMSIGLPGALDHTIVAHLAPVIESLGFRGLWLNDTPDGDALAGLEVAAIGTSTLKLGTGVIPLDRRGPNEIVGAMRGLPQERLSIGVGSGSARHPLGVVARGVRELTERSEASIVVGALGPRMRRMGAEAAGGVLFNWLTPAAAADATAELRRDARGRDVRAVLYVRTAMTEDARGALHAEADRYSSYPAYAANFERIGATAKDTTIDGSVPGELAARVAEYAPHVDEVVLRAITTEQTLGAHLEFLEKVAA